MSTLAQIHQLLAYFYGDDTIPVATDAEYIRRTAFINSAIKRLYNLREWPHLAITESKAVSSNAVALTMRPSSVLDVRYVQDGDDIIYTKVDYNDYDASSGYDIYYETSTGITTNQTRTPLTIKYIPAQVDLSATTDEVNFPASLVAKGALLEVRRQEDPEYDVTQDKQAYQEELREFTALQNRAVHKVFSSSYEL